MLTHLKSVQYFIFNHTEFSCHVTGRHNDHRQIFLTRLTNKCQFIFGHNSKVQNMFGKWIKYQSTKTTILDEPIWVNFSKIIFYKPFTVVLYKALQFSTGTKQGFKAEILETTFAFPKFRAVPWRFRVPILLVNHFVLKRSQKRKYRLFI